MALVVSLHRCNSTYLEANLDSCFSWCRDQQAQPQQMSYLPLCVGEGLLAFSMTSAFHGALLGGASGKEPTCQCRRLKRHGLDSCVGKIPWRRAWQPTPVFLPGESCGQRSLAGYSPQGCKELDMTEVTQHTHINFQINMKRVIGGRPPCYKEKHISSLQTSA